MDGQKQIIAGNNFRQQADQARSNENDSGNAGDICKVHRSFGTASKGICGILYGDAGTESDL